MAQKKRVLFLCTGNSARSQIAEGFLRHMAGDKFEVYSAGVKPTQVNPLAIKVMAEVGVDMSKHRSKSAMEFIGQKFDYVITVCDNAKQTCPVFPGHYEKLHWSLEDPAEAEGSEEDKLKVFRKIREEIKDNVLVFIKSLLLL
jgi:arsenate reductase